MHLIQIKALLLCERDYGICHATPFLGGILHGVIESSIRQHAPEIALKLGMMASSGNTVKHYSLLPPPYNSYSDISLVNHQYTVQFGVVVYGITLDETKMVASIVQQYWKEIRLQSQRDSVLTVCANVLPIDLPMFKALPSENSVRLTLQSPLQLKTLQSSSMLLDPPAAPSLLTIVRSIKRKLLAVAPERAKALGIDIDFNQQTDEWIEAEEAIRFVMPNTMHLDSVSWLYGSRTKSRNVMFYGALGTLEFQSKLPDSIFTILNWGSWLGIGEKPTFGQGMYVFDY